MNSKLGKVTAISLILCLLFLTGCSKDAISNKGEVTDEKVVTNAPGQATTITTVAKPISTTAQEEVVQTKTSYIDSLENYQGAFTTKMYRNVFVECGYTEAAIDAKLDRAWESLFYGSDSTKIYYESGEDEAYILDIGNNDVRSEGMSYGMMMCVQMDKKAEFDRLWKWAKTHMQIPNGDNEGFFRWSMNSDGTSKSNGPAPDGEEYFAMSLFFASHRWGDEAVPYDYTEEAKYILRQAIHQEEDGIGDNMWNTEKHLIKFVPNSSFTDPSYHLPHFYELFSLWADPEDSDFWKAAATASREYLKLSCNPETGLAPDYATYEGIPVSQQGHDMFSSDAFRVAGNIGLDYLWFAADPWQIEQSNRYQAFFIKEGIGKYYSKYSLEGVAQSGAEYQATGLVGMNAMASLAATGPNVKSLVADLWSKSPGMGKWRYYDDCLYFFSILSLSGNYRIWE